MGVIVAELLTHFLSRTLEESGVAALKEKRVPATQI